MPHRLPPALRLVLQLRYAQLKIILLVFAAIMVLYTLFTLIEIEIAKTRPSASNIFSINITQPVLIWQAFGILFQDMSLSFGSVLYMNEHLIKVWKYSIPRFPLYSFLMVLVRIFIFAVIFNTAAFSFWPMTMLLHFTRAPLGMLIDFLYFRNHIPWRRRIVDTLVATVIWVTVVAAYFWSTTVILFMGSLVAGFAGSIIKGFIGSTIIIIIKLVGDKVVANNIKNAAQSRAHTARDDEKAQAEQNLKVMESMIERDNNNIKIITTSTLPVAKDLFSTNAVNKLAKSRSAIFETKEDTDLTEARVTKTSNINQPGSLLKTEDEVQGKSKGGAGNELENPPQHRDMLSIIDCNETWAETEPAKRASEMTVTVREEAHPLPDVPVSMSETDSSHKGASNDIHQKDQIVQTADTSDELSTHKYIVTSCVNIITWFLIMVNTELRRAALYNIVDNTSHHLCILVAGTLTYVFASSDVPFAPLSDLCRRRVMITLPDILQRMMFLLLFKMMTDTVLVYVETKYRGFRYEEALRGLNLRWMTKTGLVCNCMILTCGIMVALRGVLPREFDETLMVCPLADWSGGGTLVL
ncbi:hypothetical protein HDV05_000405 [Chytridiales sp. JEL 0842]|nr:hypothetical protein HDV05_000405 [Chytridiales sp. JEL 0842]